MLSGISAAKRANEGFHVQVLATIDGLNNSTGAALRLDSVKNPGMLPLIASIAHYESHLASWMG
jgi:hypothetical protein